MKLKEKKEQKEKYNLIFDGTILANEFSKDNARSGIFFVAKNILNEMIKRDDINVCLYCDLSKYPTIKKYRNTYYDNHQLEIINELDFNLLYRIKVKLKALKDKNGKKEHYFKRSIFNILLLISSILCNLNNLLFEKSILIHALNNKDFFFSPVKKVPNIIKITKHIISSVYLHDTIPLIFQEYFPLVYSGKYWICKLVKSMNKNEIYFANSNCTKQDFLKATNKITDEQITVAYLAANENFKKETIENINKAKEKYNIPTNKRYIFSLCTLEPRKNLIRSVKTFIQFIKKNNIDDLVFVLGGAHWEEFISKLEAEIENLKEYKHKIIQAGYIDDEDLASLYSGAEWFVYTSQYEGFGLPTLEAMKCGCPVITSNNSSLPEVVGNASIMIDYKSDEQHIKAYEDYYYNEALRKENSKKGIERAKQFSWKECTDIIVSTLIKEKIKRDNLQETNY